MAAEAITDLRDKLTEAVMAAFTEASARVHEPAQRSQPAARRRLFGDYLAEARAAWSPGMVVTPAWVREVTACSRGLSSRLAATLASELDRNGGAGR